MIIFRCSIGLGALVTIRTKANKFSSSLHFLTLLVLLLLLLQTREVCELFFFCFRHFTFRYNVVLHIHMRAHTMFSSSCSLLPVSRFSSSFLIGKLPEEQSMKKRAKTNNEITKSCNVKFLIVCFRSMHQTSTSFFSPRVAA